MNAQKTNNELMPLRQAQNRKSVRFTKRRQLKNGSRS